MQKHKYFTWMAVGIGALLLSLPPAFILGSDQTSSPDKPAAASPDAATKPNADPNDQVNALKQSMALQQKQIEQLQKALADQQRLLEKLTESKGTTEQAAQPVKPASAAGQASQPQAPNLGEVASTTPIIPKGQTTSANAPAVPPAKPSAAPNPDPPLQLHIGDTTITPVGFMDFTGMVRSKDGGSGIGTNFGSIPYTITGNSGYSENLSEFRLNMQNSRIGFRVDGDVFGSHVIGYMEADFLGNNGGNVAVTSNSNTLRSRLYWVDLRRGGWEVLGGQTWSLITPGRNGISPLPADIFYTQNMDVNYQAGLVWGRIPEFRVVYHLPQDKAAFAIAIDSPEQYVGGSGGGGLVTFPSTLSSAYASELNVGTNTLGVPNVAPDVIAKLALQPSKRFHFEVGGIERNFKLWNPTNNQSYSTEGGGGFANLNFELFKGMRILTNNFWSDGGGRYIFGLAPDLISRTDGSPSLVHSGSTVSGFEYTNKNTLLYAYYGGVYIMRDITIDNTGSNASKPVPVGYGYTGSSSGQNRAIQEASFGVIQTFWKNAKYGALSLITQYSYLTRSPWYVASGQPANANLNMVFVDLRYTLPGSAPTLGKF